MALDASYSVTELMAASRESLVAVGPSVKSVGVSWEDGEAYDEWDLLEEVLFEVVVASAVRGDLLQYGTSRPFAPYGYHGLVYEKWSWIEVRVPGLRGPFALVRLASPHNFGEIKVVRVTEQSGPREELQVPWSPDLTFMAQLLGGDGRLTAVSDVTPVESVVQHPHDDRREANADGGGGRH